jgi:hypothetical protein
MANPQLPAIQESRVDSSELHNSVAPLQWACDAAQGKVQALKWVDSTIVDYHRSFSVRERLGQKAYRHRPYGAFLPRTMRLSAKYAQEQGEPTVLEGLLLLFAKMEWLIATRRYYWSPMSPVPKLLVSLVEAMGIDNEIHRNRPDVLSRLVARLPTWNPSRGTVQGARELLVETVGEPFSLRVAQMPKDKSVPLDPDLQDEVFVCRELGWWTRRIHSQTLDEDEKPAANMNLRVSSGLLQYQMPENPLPLHPEDVLVGWKIREPFPTNLLRLLPAWICIRVVVHSEEE